MIKLVRGVRKARRTHAPIAGATVVTKSPSATYPSVTDAQKRCRFFNMFLDNDAISRSAVGYQLFGASALQQGLVGRGLKGDPGHLFGITANLERGRRGAEGARR